MLTSCESRWFFPTSTFAVPTSVLRQFGANEPAGERVDRYLLLPGTSAVGVKWRGGDRIAFEIKALVTSPKPWNFKPGIGGLIDQWVKWSVSDPQVEAVERIFVASATWVSIRKKRFLRYFCRDGAHSIEASQPLQCAESCQVELTAIEILDQIRSPYWCSFGLEAYGRDPISILDSTAEQVFAPAGQLWLETLTGAWPVSYPNWLVMAVDSAAGRSY
jgi:hypothetical protein